MGSKASAKASPAAAVPKDLWCTETWAVATVCAVSHLHSELALGHELVVVETLQQKLQSG